MMLVYCQIIVSFNMFGERAPLRAIPCPPGSGAMKRFVEEIVSGFDQSQSQRFQCGLGPVGYIQLAVDAF